MPVAAFDGGLVEAMRAHTRRLHGEAERSGVIRDMLKGRATLEAYTLFLRNLLPAYEALERGLERHRGRPLLAGLARADLYRAGVLGADLARIKGPGWRDSLPLLPAGADYGGHIDELAARDARLLVAHAYVRYFGDLSGGQILKRLLGRTLGLGADALSFYSFPAIADIDRFKAELRAGLDEGAHELADIDGATLDEAARGFAFNIRISTAVQAVSPPSSELAAADPS